MSTSTTTTIHHCKLKELTIKIKNMEAAKQILSQITALGEKHPKFTGANFTSRLAQHGQDAWEEYSGVVFIKGQTSISSGFCKSVDEVISNLEKQLGVQRNLVAA